MTEQALAVNSEGRKATRRWHHFEDRMAQLRALGLDCDPIQVLMEVAIGQTLNKKTGILEDMLPAPEPRDKAKAAAELCSYIYPKLKSVEVTGAEGQPIQFLVTPDLTPLPVVPGQDRLTGGDLNPRTIEGEVLSPSTDHEDTVL